MTFSALWDNRPCANGDKNRTFSREITDDSDHAVLTPFFLWQRQSASIIARIISSMIHAWNIRSIKSIRFANSFIRIFDVSPTSDDWSDHSWQRDMLSMKIVLMCVIWPRTQHLGKGVEQISWTHLWMDLCGFMERKCACVVYEWRKRRSTSGSRSHFASIITVAVWLRRSDRNLDTILPFADQFRVRDTFPVSGEGKKKFASPMSNFRSPITKSHFWCAAERY